MLGLPRTFWILFAGVLVNRLGSFVLPFLALYLTGERGLAEDRAGALLALYGLGTLGAGPAGGFLADRIGRRTAMLLAMALSAAAMLQMAFARDLRHLGASLLLLGFVADMYRPGVNAAVVDLVPTEQRTRAFGYLYWAANLGFAGASFGGGLLASRGYVMLFVVDAATTLLFALGVYLLVPETLAPAPASAPAARSVDWRAPYLDRRLMRFLSAQILVAAVFMQTGSTLPLAMRHDGLGPAIFGRLIALNGVLIVLLQPISLTLLARAPRHRVLAVGTFLVGAGFASMAAARGAFGYAAAIAVFTLGEIIFTPITPAVIGELAPRHLRASYQGALQTSWGIALVAGPFLGMYVAGHVGSAAVWAGCGVAGAAAALIHLTSGGYGPARIAPGDGEAAVGRLDHP